MKQVVVAILSILILLGAFPKTNTYLFFKLAQKSIAKNLCVQKSNKLNTCQGKCYLTKKLKQNDNQSLPYAPKVKESRNTNLFCLEIDLPQFQQPILIKKKNSFHSPNDILDRFANKKLLRPPDQFSS